MNISGFNVPEPCYGIGLRELTQRWIDRERAQLAAGMTAAARQTKMMRRELQEAADLVANPAIIIARIKEPALWNGEGI
jgi:hypothetical protein